MTGADEEDTNSIKPSEFDKYRLVDLDIGGEMTQEIGNWKVLRYDRQWVLLLYNSPKLKDYNEFNTLEEMLVFLNQ